MIIDDILNILNVNQPGLVLKIIAAVVIVLLSIVIGRLLGKLVHKVLHELELDILLSRHFEFGLPAERWGSSLISFGVYVFGFVWALNLLGITTTLFRIVILAMVIIILGLILLWVKEAVTNSISRIILAHRHNLEVGDQVRIGELRGKVVKVGLFETQLESRGDQRIFVPNKLLVNATLKV